MIYIGQEFAKINGNILPLILFFIIVFFIFIGIYKLLKILKPKTKQELLNEKRAKIQKYYEVEKEITTFENIEEEKTLHVKPEIKNIEKQFFIHQANIKTPKTTYQENKKRGNDYEEFVGKYYERQGYKVIYHGLEQGKKDGGIDLIAENEYETLLIQCKAWQKAEVKQKHIKEFIGNCTTFLEDNPQNNLKVKRIFVTSSEKSEKGLDKYLIQHVGKIEYIIMPF